MSVTLKDIAKETGFSANTVSRALRGSSEISEATTAYIRDVAKKMGYIHNGVAASLRAGKSNSIAVIVGSIFNSHFAVMIKGIEEMAAENGYVVIVMNTNEDSETELKAIKTAISKKVDGIIICPTNGPEENLCLLQNSGIPFVLLGRRVKGIDASYVICDDYGGGKLATEYLINKGNKDICFLVIDQDVSSREERVNGFKDALAEAGIPFCEDMIIGKELRAPLAECLDNYRDRILKAEAILCFSDMLAHALIYWLRCNGVSVPGEIDIIGFDDIQSRIPMPIRVKSVKSFKALMSHTAYELLLEKINDPNAANRQIVISTEISEGETA
jgi:LacI family transcriptional regulator